VEKVGDISLRLHAKRLLAHAQNGWEPGARSLRDLPPLSPEKKNKTFVISAGPSLHRKNSIQRILAQKFSGVKVAVDAAMVKCLKQGLVPDYVVTLDPHPTRMVRWFGDPDFEKHSAADDYFQRQDLDVEFRKNTIRENEQNIELINRFGPQMKALVASSAPANVLARIKQAGFGTYFFNPLVDDPETKESITRKLSAINGFPCVNTGGNVGTCAWILAATIFGIKMIGLLGMDFGYYHDLPRRETQKYYELLEFLQDDEDLDAYFPEFLYPGTGEPMYTDPTYFWYRQNFLELLPLVSSKTYNCTEGGTLFSDHLPCCSIEEFLQA